MQYLLPIIVMANFAAGLTLRAIDPVLPQIGGELAVSITTAATLVSATSIAFAVVQLPLGAIADRFGKPRLIVVSLVLLGLSNIVGAFTSSFEVLLATRVVCGATTGGIFPVTVGLIGDLFPLQQRRVAMSRIAAGAMSGTLLGAAFTGLVGDLFGWRGALIALGAIMLLTSCVIAFGFRGQLGSRRHGIDISMVLANYRRVFAQPQARLCFLGVFTEACCVHGLNPFMAAFLQELGEPRLSIAGLVIGGYAVGGIIYAFSISYVLRLIGDNALMAVGAFLMASQIVLIGLGPPWQVQFLNFVVLGIGFYLLHGGLQLVTSELVPDARASAVSLQGVFFNGGLFFGPLAYGAGLLTVGKLPTLIIAALVMMVVALICARWLRPNPFRDEQTETT